MEKSSWKLLFLITFWLVATGPLFMGEIAEARTIGGGPPQCKQDKDCNAYCKFFNYPHAVCVINVCDCHQNSATLLEQENKDTKLKRHKYL
ncbi:hypothetical protein P3S68_030214 [Capsicum galapagoense]